MSVKLLAVITLFVLTFSCKKNPETISNTNPPPTDTLGKSTILLGCKISSDIKIEFFSIRGNGSDYTSFILPDSIIGTTIGYNGGLCKSFNGNVYGVSAFGGKFNQGTIFMLDPNLKKAKKLLDLNNLTIGNNFPKLTLSPDSNLYSFGGPYSLLNQAILKINPRKDTCTFPWYGSTLFSGAISGQFALGPDKNLYAITRLGSQQGLGGFIKYNFLDSSLTPYGSIPGNFGKFFSIVVPPLLGKDGNFYTLGEDGGTNNLGTILSFNPTTGSYLKVHDFSDPYSNPGPIIDNDNNLVRVTDTKFYGTTNSGGVDDIGTIFSFDITTKTKKIEYSFLRSDNIGSNPGYLIKSTDNMIFGFTGTHLFRYDFVTNRIKSIRSFGSFGVTDLITY